MSLPRNIKTIKAILLAKEKLGVEPELNSTEARFIQQTAGLLLLSAITENEKLRKIANALDAEEKIAAQPDSAIFARLKST